MSAPSESTNQPVELPQEQPASTDSSAANDELMDAVMRQTAAALNERSLASLVDLPKFREIARRHPSDTLSLDPILVELIAATLETHLSKVCRTDAMRMRIAQEIARPLFENPVSRGRLELLWSQLLDRAK
jgi:hypothetical protein